jgi:hypothetical protein
MSFRSRKQPEFEIVSKKLASPITFKFGLEGGWELHFEVQVNKGAAVKAGFDLSDRAEVRTKLLRNGRIATKREEELWRNTTPFVETILVKEFSDALARGEEKIPAKLGEWIDQYKKATSLCRSRKPSPERMKGALFFEFWRLETLTAEESGQKISDSDQIKLLRPLLIALSEFNSEFVRGVAEAMQILSKRIYKSKDGSGEYLDRWLLDYELRLPRSSRGEHTPEEIKKLVSKFSSITEKKLHEKLHKLPIRHKDKPRGQASPNYGFEKKWAEFRAQLNRE